jgi:hypothetical protein
MPGERGTLARFVGFGVCRVEQPRRKIQPALMVLRASIVTRFK